MKKVKSLWIGDRFSNAWKTQAGAMRRAARVGGDLLALEDGTFAVRGPETGNGTRVVYLPRKSVLWVPVTA
jgi:hypothetical protein